ncbi:unnamed protein product [Rotaria socialis]|uniref:Serine/threonine-protein kinase receptor n=2 Tax=Rotaria socialis TaxID=392032 RepID=A0A818AUG9_9BILA|nr:unnamed protein product [Rotaria socialis]CAF3382641.1 unnamed protein product [Rotaria socialis]CAF3408856.1 unnamed protein product [Rotaria socialis]CAF3425171.1 unnamed protein product [Rotaria socialis]CAF4173759.1 unnamed protein product [Rotaria socialis]
MKLIYSILVFVNLINIFHTLVCPIYPSRKINSRQFQSIKTCDTNCTFSSVLEKHNACLGVYYNYSGIILIKQLDVIYSDVQCLTSKKCLLEIDSKNSQSFSCCCTTDNCTLDWQTIAATTYRTIFINHTATIETIIITEDQYSWKLLSIIITFVIIIVLIIFGLCLWKSRGNKYVNEDRKSLPPSMEDLFFSAQELNVGKSSIVYKAILEHNIAALKVYNQANILIWKNEITILKSIKHESIIRILSEGQYDSHLYLLLPFYENGTLQSYLHARSKKLSMNQCLRFLRTLAAAISYLHTGNNSIHTTIVHRDIKSSNILIDKNELNLCLTDFGVAMALPPVLTEKDFVQIGTMRYMAPELLEGVIAHTREALCSVDMYALALVMWEILTQCEEYPTTEYCPPYEEYRKKTSDGSSFTSEIYDIVVVHRLRPSLIRPLKDNPHVLIMDELCSLIDACWITDSDMRMNAQTLAFKLNQHT